jgi:uncharacterized RDD family membrane protein YckC
VKAESVPQPSLVGHYAGPVSRAAAFAVDVGLSTFILAVSVRVVAGLCDFVFSTSIDYSDLPPFVGFAIVVSWLFIYYFVSWSLAGKTAGMGILGLRVVRRDGSKLGKGKAFIRTITFPLSFLFFGLGLVGIVVGREHRAFHDVCADTTVVYDWDARAARLRIHAAGATADLAPAEPGDRR